MCNRVHIRHKIWQKQHNFVLLLNEKILKISIFPPQKGLEIPGGLKDQKYYRNVWVQKIAIPPRMVLWFGPSYPTWNFQFCFILSLQKLDFWDPPPPWNFQWPSLWWVWTFSGTTQCMKLNLNFYRGLGSYFKKPLLWRRYGCFMDQHNFYNFIIYNIIISQPLHLHHLPQYIVRQLLQGAEALQLCHCTIQAVHPFWLYLGGP